jgi:hypothetical protein
MKEDKQKLADCEFTPVLYKKGWIMEKGVQPTGI